MKLHFSVLLLILAFSFFLGVVVATHEVLSPKEYWQKMLPNTPMPKTIQDSLPSEKNTGVDVGRHGVDVNAGKPGKGTNVHVGNGGVNVNVGHGGTNVHVGRGVDVNVGKPGKGATNVHVGRGRVSVHAGGNPFLYNYAASETQLHDNPNVALFFLEKDLKVGTHMNLHFTKTTNDVAFLPRHVAESIPFASDKIPEILTRFNLKPSSDQAEEIKQTVKECEEKGTEGEEKFCATSLEAMLGFATTKLGSAVAMVTSSHAEKDTPMQKYAFTAVRAVHGRESVVCHKQKYLYAVFYCHVASSTKTYEVAMVGADGVRTKAAVVCHVDTSKWNPNHLAFKVLGVRPGSVPICHFLPEDHIVWIRK